MSKKANYAQSYRKEWESVPELSGWLSGENESAKCLKCNVNLKPHLGDLKRHALGSKHILNCKLSASTRKISFKSKSDKLTYDETKKRKEIRLALFTAIKTSISTIDSLTPLLNQEYDDSLKLKRSKCSAIIIKILAPHFKEDLKEDL